MRAKDKTLSRHYWFSFLSPFSHSLYPLATFSVICIHESVYIGSRKTDLCPILCSFLIVINLIIQRFGFCIMSWLELNQAKPSPFWNSKQFFFLSQVPSYCKSKIVCVRSIVPDVSWKSIQLNRYLCSAL